jgi:uncharacterized protein YdhG (YjbR/CyaY superfamily)
MMKSAAEDIAGYIAAQPAPVRPVLEQLRRVIGKAIPAATEAISYGMPAFKLDGRVVVYFAAWKQHTALYPGSAQTFALFKDEVAGYATSKGTLQFPFGEPLPVKLITTIAKHRAKEVAEINRARPARRATSAGKSKPARRPAAKTRAKTVRSR